MSRKSARLLRVVLLGGFYTVCACAHDKAWISTKERSGGRIGYYQSSFANDRESVVRDFRKVALKICGSPKWTVVKEFIPPPTSAISAIKNASSGDVKGAAEAGGNVLIHDVISRSKRLDKEVKVEYGSPLKTWNEAEIRCN